MYNLLPFTKSLTVALKCPVASVFTDTASLFCTLYICTLAFCRGLLPFLTTPDIHNACSIGYLYDMLSALKASAPIILLLADNNHILIFWSVWMFELSEYVSGKGTGDNNSSVKLSISNAVLILPAFSGIYLTNTELPPMVSLALVEMLLPPIRNTRWARMLPALLHSHNVISPGVHPDKSAMQTPFLRCNFLMPKLEWYIAIPKESIGSLSSVSARA